MVIKAIFLMIFLSFAITGVFAQAGALDHTFGGDGIVTTDFGSSEEAYTIAIQSDGKIVAAGYTGGDVALARYTVNGALDNSFGINGLVIRLCQLVLRFVDFDLRF